MTPLTAEKLYPYLIGLIGGLAAYFGMTDSAIRKAVNELPNPLLTVTAISLGFIGTTQAILMSAGSSRTIRRLSKRTQTKRSYMDLLHSYLNQATVLAVLATLLSTIPILLEFDGPIWIRLYLAIWIAVTVTAFFAFVRVVTVMSQLLQGFQAESSEQP